MHLLFSCVICRFSNAHCHNFCLNHVCCCLGYFCSHFSADPKSLDVLKTWVHSILCRLFNLITDYCFGSSSSSIIGTIEWRCSISWWLDVITLTQSNITGSNFWGSKSYGLLSHAKSWGSSCSLCSPCSNAHVSIGLWDISPVFFDPWSVTLRRFWAAVAGGARPWLAVGGAYEQRCASLYCQQCTACHVTICNTSRYSRQSVWNELNSNMLHPSLRSFLDWLQKNQYEVQCRGIEIGAGRLTKSRNPVFKLARLKDTVAQGVVQFRHRPHIRVCWCVEHVSLPHSSVLRRRRYMHSYERLLVIIIHSVLLLTTFLPILHKKYVTCLVESFREVILVLYCLSVLSMNWLKSLDQCLLLQNFLPMIWKLYTLKC